MRREMAEYDRSFPENNGWRKLLAGSIESLALRWLRWRLRGTPLGSPRWHVLQEKLSQGAAVGLGVRLRNAFYVATLGSDCEGIHVLPQVAVYYPRNVRIGRSAFINRGAYIVAPAPVQIGTNVLIGPYVVINSGSHRYSDSTRIIREQGHKLEPIVIEDDVWIGAHSVILPGVTLGKGCIVGAGSVVTKSVPAFQVVCGVPATRVIGQRVDTGGNSG